MMRFLLVAVISLTAATTALAEDCGMSWFDFPNMVCGRDLHWENTYVLIHTRPGERVMRPELGVDWDDLCFAPVTDDKLAAMAGVLKHQIQVNAGLDVDVVEVVQVASDDGLPAFEIRIVYYPNGRTEPTDELVMPYRCGA